MEDVRLPDLEVIKKFSIAVRQEHAPADEVIAALRADLERITHARTSRAAVRTPARAPAKRKPAKTKR